MGDRGVTRAALGALAVAAALGAMTTTPAAAQLSQIYQAPGISPPGANDPACKPSAGRPVPVILVHGTFTDMTGSWNTLSPMLVQRGYCVFALDLVRRASAPLDESADKLAAFVADVRKQTGAPKVSLVGHSQGGMLGRYYVRLRDGLAKVDDVVGLAPSSHGTESPLAPTVGTLADCPACTEQMAGSPQMQRLNAGEEAPPPVSYTVVSTRYDQVVTPYQSQALRGPTVTNVVVQDRCPTDLTDHVGITYDPVALQWVIDALGRPGPASPAFAPDCSGLTDGSGPPPAPGGPARSSDPERGLRLSTRASRIDRRGRLAVRSRCYGPAESACSGTLDLRARIPGARDPVRLGRSAFRISANSSRAIRVRISSRGRALLRRHGRLRTTAIAFVEAEGGAARTSSATFTARSRRG